MPQAQEKSVPATIDNSGGATLLLDLGSKSRKQVKKLRKGKGSLMQRVSATIEQLREDDELSPSADVVVVIVKQKSKSKGWRF
jgi:hypothetical protein